MAETFVYNPFHEQISIEIANELILRIKRWNSYDDSSVFMAGFEEFLSKWFFSGEYDYSLFIVINSFLVKM